MAAEKAVTAVHEWLTYYQKDPDRALSHVADEVVYKFEPAQSLPFPNFDRKGMENIMRNGFKSLEMKILDTVVNADGSKVAIESASDAIRADGTEWKNYYMWFFYLNKEGKITYVNEMLDSAYVGYCREARGAGGDASEPQSRKQLKMEPL
ncbi:hypothetical protein DFJ74DRAFT_664187 [Hyaloraphidium curvatum]|nr:hypothetical protein DFJ74DRAFT_664187 [Hyaloraphidium curvatum]